MFYELIIGLVTLLVAVILYFKWIYSYWARKSVPYLEPSIPFGNDLNPFTKDVPNFIVIKRLHEYFRRNGHKHGGIYFAVNQMYMPVDLDLIRNILAKDFASFTDRGVYYDEKNDPLSAHLFSLEGQTWRNMRTKLTPTFTSGKMKMMFQTLLDCGEQLEDYIDKLSAAGEPLDIKDILGSFTTDVIGSCAFGIDCNSFKDPNSEFRSHGRKIFTGNFWRKVRMFFILALPKLAKKIGLPLFEPALTNFFLNVIKSMMKYREENDVKRNDFLQLLLELKNSANSITIEQLAAQAFVFFLAGFETSSTTMNFCLFELAQNLEIQEKVRQEILKVLGEHDGKLTYDGIMEMKYMGQVIDETLRKHPPVPTLLRKCVLEYKVPDTDVVLEKGMRVFISVMGIHSDPELYPEPDKFDPERFSDENKADRHPYAFLPFGEGPRNCIGLRFGLMQTRVGLSLILKKYRLKLSPKTELPLVLDPNAFLLRTQQKIWMVAEKIK